MTGNLTTTKKIASVVGISAVLFGAVACSKTVEGKATAAPVEQTTDPTTDAPPPTTDPTTEPTTDPTTDPTTETTSTSSDDDDNPPAQAPDEPYVYNNGVTVTMSPSEPDPFGDDRATIGDEEPRIIPFTIENVSDTNLDLSGTEYASNIDCENGDTPWIFAVETPDGSTSDLEVPGGETKDFVLAFALVPDTVGVKCTITLPFEAEGYSSTDIDDAKFVMELS